MSEVSLLNKILAGVAVFFILIMSLQLSDLKFRVVNAEYQLEKLRVEAAAERPVEADNSSQRLSEIEDDLKSAKRKISFLDGQIVYLESQINFLKNDIHIHE
jgi:septal ring factor EnvC (AmiA/AmiB activator)